VGSSGIDSVQSSGTLEDSELTKLRFDKQALESQLRKFASQCQQLEDEKQRIIHTFKSAKIQVADENIEKAIVALCDKVASLEQECDCLAHFKNKAFSNQVELATLQEQKTELMSKITDLQRKIDNMQWIESGHKNLISSLTEGTTKLQHDIDHTRQETASMRNQLKYLEQENLQLMRDYKAAKQKIHSLKAEVNQLHSQMPIAAIATTRDVGKSSAKKHPKTPNDKENEKRRANRDSVQQKIPPCSVARSNEDNKKNPVTSRLGDAFAASEENTQECKQS
jgi:chromosome segregation ATPase